jgi:hypothetical protein
MKVRNIFLTIALVLGLAVSGVTIAQKVNPERHPNLAAAQDLANQAYVKITAAQVANEFDMDGHAAKAKELLRQANEEIKLAAVSANKNHK